jgi:hypothetical protein
LSRSRRAPEGRHARGAAPEPRGTAPVPRGRGRACRCDWGLRPPAGPGATPAVPRLGLCPRRCRHARVPLGSVRAAKGRARASEATPRARRGQGLPHRGRTHAGEPGGRAPSEPAPQGPRSRGRAPMRPGPGYRARDRAIGAAAPCLAGTACPTPLPRAAPERTRACPRRRGPVSGAALPCGRGRAAEPATEPSGQPRRA